MPYSLVSAATLGFDLVRLPAGRQVATTLLAAMTAGPAELARVAAVHPARGLDAAGRGAVAVRSRRARELAAGVPQVRRLGADAAGAAGADRTADRTAVLVAQLEQGTIGDAPTLERLLREDVLGPEHPAVGQLAPEVADGAADVLADAAVGWWAAGVLPPLVRRALTEPFERALDGDADGDAAERAAERLADLGPGSDRLAGLLTGLRDLDATGRAGWRAAVDAGRVRQRPWAAAMHEASWAAHVAGRTRTLATAHLLAVPAFLDGGFDGRDGAHGLWNAVAGCVQGLAMADLLDEASLEVLTAPLGRPRPAA